MLVKHFKNSGNRWTKNASEHFSLLSVLPNIAAENSHKIEWYTATTGGRNKANKK
jgi:hypothetical protein